MARLSEAALRRLDEARERAEALSQELSDPAIFEDARTMLGMHWGTFDLADEPLDEPPARMLADINRRGIDPTRAWVLKIAETRAW